MSDLSKFAMIPVIASCLMVAGCGERSVPEQAKTLPKSPAPAAAQKYDGKIVHQPDANRGKDDGWFLVKDGKRRWIMKKEWLQQNGFKETEVIYITSEEFNSIPEDPVPVDK
jgi:hypothetical protein